MGDRIEVIVSGELAEFLTWVREHGMIMSEVKQQVETCVIMFANSKQPKKDQEKEDA